MTIVDITYESPKIAKMKNIAKYEQTAKEYTQILAKESGTLSDRPSNYNILSDYYNHLISYYANNPTLLDAFFLYQYSDTMITIFDALNRKIFKGGFQKIPLKDNPSQAEEQMIDHLLFNANENNETLKEVFKQVEVAGNWSNLRAFLILKEYKRKGSELITSAVKQIIHIDPLTLEPLKDGRGRLGYEKSTGNKLYFSLEQRNKWTYQEKSNGKPNLQADYRVVTDDGYMYYNRTELIVKKKFPANPMFALKNKILSMIAQDKHIMNEYSEGKPTKKLLLFKGKNLDEVKTSVKEFSNANRENPNKQHIMMMGGVENGQAMTEVVDLVRSLEEMEATDMRNEFRNAMGAPYGVAPIYQNDASTGGGLNNEGLQITVTNEAIESNKDDYNEFLKQIFNVCLGITDYEVKLMPNEEEDESFIEDLLKKKLENAQMLLDLGGEVKFMPDNKDKTYNFNYKESSLKKVEQSNPFESGGENNLRDMGQQVGKEFVDDIKKPCGDYDSFMQCVSQNQDKRDPEAYCNTLRQDVEKEKKIKLPSKSALEITTDEYSKEFEKLVKESINKV